MNQSPLSESHTKESLVDLLSRVAQGDRLAFSELYESTHRKLFGIVYRILKNQAVSEEVLQEVYLKIWEKAASFDASVASPITWMATIARNRTIDEVRKNKLPDSDIDVDFDLIADDSMAPADLFTKSQDLLKLEACLGDLESPRAEMIKAAYLDGFSRQELAERFKQPLGTIKTWLHRSIKQLQGCMKL
ncbi:sigma-70 family RNA polymerase sigma factor [Marinomonas rhizomae]|uniref:RNA polymerase sigma-70 factor (ECF subfamily) n=1 Tax=Marinomonas rhizomae TaxID=491948 RepID=A0A366J6H9_9GAMM|nr:sigma-70 family RNA polymerase sigma factor [Marinomonas rhizomae]RBP82522.1 RNA polymerase sigma-70 factor (ECF subfamily) [Marinomonas rhizomae]RNF73691.1 sigma-70 family RNA polymerase sigma factor [Marinomonas rhizomae]